MPIYIPFFLESLTQSDRFLAESLASYPILSHKHGYDIDHKAVYWHTHKTVITPLTSSWSIKIVRPWKEWELASLNIYLIYTQISCLVAFVYMIQEESYKNILSYLRQDTLVIYLHSQSL